MFDPKTPEGIALTMRHDFGLLEGEERERALVTPARLTEMGF